MDWFLYDNGLHHERVKLPGNDLDFYLFHLSHKLQHLMLWYFLSHVIMACVKVLWSESEGSQFEPH